MSGKSCESSDNGEFGDYGYIGESGGSSESCYSGDLGDYGHSGDFN